MLSSSLKAGMITSIGGRWSVGLMRTGPDQPHQAEEHGDKHEQVGRAGKGDGGGDQRVFAEFARSARWRRRWSPATETSTQMTRMMSSARSLPR